MKQYNRLMLGSKSIHLEECIKNNFIGVDFGITQDLSNDLNGTWQDFKDVYVPMWMKNNPTKSKVPAGLACGAIWTVVKNLKKGDIILSPNGTGKYYIAEITGDYTYSPDNILQHRREVRWFETTIDRSSMSLNLKNSAGSILTTCDLTSYSEEIENLLKGESTTTHIIETTPQEIEEQVNFALEKHLEDFLIANWTSTELGKGYDILKDENGDIIGKQFPTDTGPIDILATSKDKKELLIVELKKGRASDSVVGQIQRYMGYIKEEYAEEGQTVRGIIITLEDDKRIKRALSVAPNISFCTYFMVFKLNHIFGPNIF